MPPFVVCDVETTGLDPKHDQIIEVALVKVDGCEIEQTFATLVKPSITLPLNIKRLTGLEEEMFADSPQPHEVAAQVRDFLGNLPLAGHNISFDASFLQHYFGVHAAVLLDTLELARVLYPTAPAYNLGDLCTFTGVKISQQHRALPDALAAAELINVALADLKRMHMACLARIHQLFEQAGSTWSTWTGAVLAKKLSAFPGETLNLTDYVTSPRNKEMFHLTGGYTKTPELKSTADMEEFFSPQGLLSKEVLNFESRPQQVEMAKYVAKALREKKCLLMEAGTGTGKTLAYLIPSILWALANGQRALIATHTVNLQDQLWYHDLPLVKKITSQEYSATVIKGRGNYLCLRRLELALDNPENLNPGKLFFLARILVWLSNTRAGDRSELNLDSAEREYWRSLCSEVETCHPWQCRWFKKYCFLNRARKAAEHANLIITNHALLLTDLFAEQKFLPSYGALIIDEAHHLEEAATQHMSKKISRSLLKRWLQAVGLVAGRLPATPRPWDDEGRVLEALTLLKRERDRAAEQVTIAFAYFYEQAGFSARDTINVRWKENDRLHNCLRTTTLYLIAALKQVIKCSEDLIHLIEKHSPLDSLVEETYSLRELIEQGNILLQDLDHITAARDPNYVFWAQRTGNNDMILYASPIRVGELLHTSLLMEERGIILTSATLTVGDSFDFFMQRTGIDLLPAEKVMKRHAPSPFAYEQQCMLCIDTGLDAPGPFESASYYDSLSASLREYIAATEGRTLVLFTSRRALAEVYYRLKPFMEEMDICLLAHKINGGRTRLLEKFRRNPRTVLLGTASFWEGIDVPGPALCNVIIVKLPFTPPSMPIVEARLEEINSSGGDAFNQFTVPQAVIRFKQGFGRLIRSMKDRGCVVVMDKRLITKKYGRTFLQSLPVKNYILGDAKKISHIIANWRTEANW